MSGRKAYRVQEYWWRNVHAGKVVGRQLYDQSTTNRRGDAAHESSDNLRCPTMIARNGYYASSKAADCDFPGRWLTDL